MSMGIGPGLPQRLPGIEDIGAPSGGTPEADAAGGGFAGLLAGLSGVEQATDAAVTDMAVGGDKDLHDVVLAVEMESLSFDLAVQIRNRLVDAYHEIFRMQV